MTTTVGHIKGLIGADTASWKAGARYVRGDARDLKQDVERQKPDIDANEKPFVAAVARATAAKNALDAKIQKTITALEANLAKAGDAEETALGRIRVAQATLDAVRDKSPEATDRITAAEERLAKAQRDLVAIQRDTTVMTDRLAQERLKLVHSEDQHAGALEATAEAAKKAAAEEEKLADSTDKVAKANDKASMSAVKHAASLVKLIGGLLGVNAAMLAGGVAAGAAVGAVPVLAIAAAAMLLSSNQKVADSFQDLAGAVAQDAREMAQPLEDDLVRASDDMAASWSRLRGPIQQIFSDSQPAVRELTRGVTELAENAVPGMATAVSRSQPVMVGWRKLLSDTGKGASDFFRNVSSDSESSGRNIEAFGKVIRTVLSAAGTLLQQLSTNAAPHAEQFARVFQRVMDVITKITENALPVFSTTLGVALDVLEAVLKVVEPIADHLGTGIGVILSAAAAWKVYAAAISLVSKVPLASALTSSLTAAAPAGGILARLGLGASGAAAGTGALAGAMSPLGMALAATGLIMGAYLIQQQKIDQGADSFVQGILKGGEAAQKAASDYAALQKNLADLIAKRDAWNASDAARAAGADDVVGSKMNDQIFAMTQNVDAARKKWDEYLASVGPVERAQAQLNLAIAQYGKDSPQATAAGAVYRAEVAKQEAASKAAADAVKSHTDRINENHAAQKNAVGAGLDYEAALLSLEGAQKNLNQAVAQYGPQSLEARTAENQYQQQLLATVDAIGVKTAAENQGKSASEIATLVTQAETAEILRLAAAAGDNAPAALQAMIAKMDGAALAAMGVTVKVDEAGRAIITMPDGKQIVITGDNAEALRKVAEVNAAEVRSKTLYIDLVTRADSKVAADWLTSGRNKGGWVPGSGPDVDSQLTPTTPGEFVVRRAAAQKWGPFLEAINKAAGGDVKLPKGKAMPMLGGASMPQLPPASIPAPRAGSGSGVDGGMGPSKVVHDSRSFHFHELKQVPTTKWLRDTLEDIENGVLA